MMAWLRPAGLVLFAVAAGAGLTAGDEGAGDAVTSDAEPSGPAEPAETHEEPAGRVRMAKLQPPGAPIAPVVPQPFEAPQAPVTPAAPARSLFAGLRPPTEALSAPRLSRLRRPSADLVVGGEAKVRVTTDAGDLLGEAPSAVGTTTQKRTPIVNEPRVRGSSVGELIASGSYWVPARQDLDTVLNKIDSRIIDDTIIIKGPYSARYGPGANFIDVQFLPSPRFYGGYETHGSSSFDYSTNGEQWYGRQTFWGGDADWGFRLGYGHRTGNDYESGDGTEIPASYKSRDVDFAFGADLSPDSRIEFHLLRLDQTDVEFAGQAFDMDFLVTDAYEIEYTLANQPYFDLLVAEVWYNRTRFEGDSQRSGKREQNPVLDEFEFIGFTDADVMSTGYSVALSWGEAPGSQFTLGTDLRYVKQGLNEFNRFRARGLNPAPTNPFDPFDVFPPFFPEIEKAVPRSHSSNPGVFAEHVMEVGDRLLVTAGGRADWVSTNIDDERSAQLFTIAGAFIVPDPLRPGELELVIPVVPGAVVPFNEFLPERHFGLGSFFLTAEYELDCHWRAIGGAGFAMSPPTLTELYSFNGPFLAVLQRGGNFVFGNPDLDPERRWQVDLGLLADYGRMRGGVNGFYAWINDYVTLRPLLPLQLIPEDFAGVTPVQWTNTDLATLAGGEAFAEYDWNAWTTLFGTMSYVEGRDHDRATSGAFPPLPFPIPAVPPGEEPLPGIAPLESRLGVRFHGAGPQPQWGVELSARVVDNQDRVARTLREQETPGFTTYDIRSFWQARENLLIVAGVENFTDKQYREHLDLRTGVFQPGINYYFGSELTY